MSKRRDASLVDAPLPELTPAVAGEFAKLLHAGCPQDLAVRYLYPAAGSERVKAVVRAWAGHPEAHRAVEALLGGAWLEMDADRRYGLALDKHFGELAFYLWANNFNTVESREEIEKMKVAREVLLARVKPGAEADNPLEAFTRLATALLQERETERAARSKVMPALQPPVLGRVRAPEPEREM